MGLTQSFTDNIAAENLSQNMTTLIEGCQGMTESLKSYLKSSMAVDSVRQKRVDFGYKAFGDIIMAASYSIPGCGSTVKTMISLFRNRNLKDAWWLARNDASWVGTGAKGLDTGYGNGVHAPVNMQQHSSSGDTNMYRSTAFTAAADAPWWKDGKPGNMLYQCEGDVAAAASDLKGQLPGVDPQQALSAMGLAGIGASTWEDVLALVRYKQVISQLSEIAAGGQSAVLPYVLAGMASSVNVSKGGLAIAELGGWKNSDGRFAIGAAEVETGKTEVAMRQYNRVAKGWEDRLWWSEHSNMVDGQTKMDARKARAIYDGFDFSHKKIDEIILFKAKITVYRYDMEVELAKGSKFGNVTRAVLNDVSEGDFNLSSNGFGSHGYAYKMLWGRNGIFHRLGNLLSFGYCFQTTASAESRAQLMLDCYIIYKILELHLGTPWPASLAYNPQTRVNVARALADAMVTVVMSKAIGPNRKGYFKSRGSKTDLTPLFPKSDIFSSPTIAGFWSPIAYLASRPIPPVDFLSMRVNANRLVSSSRESMVGEFMAEFAQVTVEGFAYSIPCYSSKGIEAGVLTYASRLGSGVLSRTLIRPSIEGTYSKLFSRSPATTLLEGRVTVWRSAVEDVDALQKKFNDILEHSLWTDRGKDAVGGGQTNFVNSYSSWVNKRTFFGSDPTEVAKITAKYAGFGRLADPMLNAYQAQKMSVELMVNKMEKPEIVLKLMHDTVRQLVKKVRNLENGGRDMGSLSKHVESLLHFKRD